MENNCRKKLYYHLSLIKTFTKLQIDNHQPLHAECVISNLLKTRNCYQENHSRERINSVLCHTKIISSLWEQRSSFPINKTLQEEYKSRKNENPSII